MLLPARIRGTGLGFVLFSLAVNAMDQYSARGRPTSRESALVGPDHPTAALPRRRLAVLRPGELVVGVITRLIRGGALVDIQLESNEPAFLPLRSIPVKAMPVIRELIDTAAVQSFRIDQLDRAQGTATLSIEGLIRIPEDQKAAPRGTASPSPTPPPSRAARTKPSAGEIAKQRQQELLRRLRQGTSDV